MPTTLASSAIETSTYVVTISFKDEDGELVVPNSVTWNLYDKDGNIVNAKENQTETPATSVDIVLSNGDINYEDGERRILQVWGTYDSSLGSNLPYADECYFNIKDLTSR